MVETTRATLMQRLDESATAQTDLAALLDGMSHDKRAELVLSLGKAPQKRLWEICEGSRVSLADLVPDELAEDTEVRHLGRNSLPLFTRFEKRFLRPSGLAEDDEPQLWGYNFQTLQAVTGPGYFVCAMDPDRDSAAIDYRRVPPRAPEGWPAVRVNDRGLSTLVYGHMVDHLRKVSSEVIIGRAWKHGGWLPHTFLLVRVPVDS